MAGIFEFDCEGVQSETAPEIFNDLLGPILPIPSTFVMCQVPD